MEHRLRSPAVLLAGALVGPLSAQVNKLSGTLPYEIRNGHVVEYRASADGTRVVYRADKRVVGVGELFSAPADGSAPSVRLNDPLPPGGRVEGDGGPSFVLASANRVVYRADQTTDGIHEILVVPIDGSARPTRVTPAGFDVIGYWVTPADELLFRGAGLDLFRVPLAGGTPQGIAFNRFVERAWVSPDGATTVFSAVRDPSSQYLLRVPTDGSAAPVQLDASEPQNNPDFETYFDDVRFAPDGIHVLYAEALVDYDSRGSYEDADLRSATLDGSHPAVTLNQTGDFDTFVLDPGPSGRVVFAEADWANSVALDGTGFLALGEMEDSWGRPLVVSGGDVYFPTSDVAGRSIWRAAIDGSQPPAPLFAAAPLGIRTIELVDPATLAFAAWNGGPFGGVYSVPVGGGIPLLLNPLLPHYGAIEIDIVPGTREIVYQAAPGMNQADDLYVVSADGGAPPVLLSSPLVSGDVSTFTIAPGNRVVYTARQGSPFVGNGVFGAPLSGAGPVVHLNDAIVSDTLAGDVTGFRSTRDGAIAVYRADQEADESYDLYAADPSGLGTPLRLTGGLAGAPLVLADFELTPAGERVIFQTSSGGTYALRSAPTATAASSVVLDTFAFQLASSVRTSPDGTRVVYLQSGGMRELRSVLADGAAAPVTLHTQVQEFELAPDGARVVFRAGSQLYSIPLDGSAPAVRLHAPLDITRAVRAFRIGADGRRAVFSGDLAVDELVELYSAPIGGGAVPRKLSGPLVAGGDVAEFVLSPDGRSVVYRADQLANQRFDLFSVPVQGRVRRAGVPAPGATLLTALTGTRSVEPDFATSPDGAQVVYRCKQDAAGDVELFRVPTDGSTAPVQLSAPLVAGGDVRSFAIAPDGSRVVYAADRRVAFVIELSSVPLAGGAAVVLDPLPDFADVSEYRIDPESRRVVYRTNRLPQWNLYAAPLDASAPAVRVNRLLHAGSGVQGDFVVAPGGRTFYRADQEQAAAFELYVALDLADALLPAARARVR